MHLEPLMDTITNLLVGLLAIQLAEDMITFSAQIKLILKALRTCKPLVNQE